MARITVDVTSAYTQGAGIGRLTREVMRALAALPHPHQVSFYRMGRVPAPADVDPLAATRGPLSDRWLQRIWFRAGLRLPVELFGAARSDLFHATDFVLPPLLPGTRSVLTVHDLTFERDPDSAVPTLLKFLKRVVPESVRRADHIIADSHATARDLHTLYGVQPARLSVVHAGVSAQFSPEPAAPDEATRLRAAHKLGDGPLVLAVGTLQRRKNHITLVRAFASARARLPTGARLVIAGGKGWLYDDVLAEVTRLHLGDAVRFTGFLPEADLPALYRAAAVLSFPSLYEGFGIPLLEAMASGTPVVSSNASSLPEVYGEVGLSHAPTDVDALSEALVRALTDAPWRSTQREVGLARARTFTWARAAREVLDIYNRVLK
jgi:glycosyltransferase involved in cell wall biosynthesis